MKNDEVNRLTVYATKLLNLLSSPAPVKHKNREAQYREYLTKDLKATQAKIEALRLSGGK
jgi:hypothetical protein